MHESAQAPSRTGRPLWLNRLAEERPDLLFMGPYLVYLALLALMSLRDVLGEHWVWVFNLVRGIGGLAAVWMVRPYLPPWGKPHLLLAVIAAALTALLWAAGHHLAIQLGIPQRLPLPLFGGEPTPPEEINPFNKLGHGWLAWTTIVTKIGTAATTVAFVEELFWRAFLLRALINWAQFERIPLGTFTWFSFLFSSLLSTLQHPDHWFVSILCWFAFNGLMYWKKSILFMVLVHGLTNLFLYVYVVAYGDWIFW